MPLFLAFIVARWRLFAAIAGGLVLVLLLVFAYKGCKSEPKLNQKEIIEAQQAIEKQERQKMIEILAESEAREQGIDNSIKAAEQATEAAKQNYTSKSNQELADELNRRARGE
jgi:ABC-type protease/lipase transport system fused ATPase/permease subunit